MENFSHQILRDNVRAMFSIVCYLKIT